MHIQVLKSESVIKFEEVNFLDESKDRQTNVTSALSVQSTSSISSQRDSDSDYDVSKYNHKEMNEESLIDAPLQCSLRSDRKPSTLTCISNSSQKIKTQKITRKCRERSKKEQREKQQKKPTSSDVSKQDSKKDEIDKRIAQYMNLTCYVCNMELPNFAEMRKHIKQVHDCKSYVMCCNSKFYNRNELADHVAQHLNLDLYKCDDCNMRFASKKSMRNHFRSLKHQPDAVKTFECEHCQKKFTKQCYLEKHRIKHGAKTHVCDLCKKSYASGRLLNRHVRVYHTNNGRMCEICAKWIRSRAAFERHQLEHAGISLPKVQCDICGNWYKDNITLKKHKSLHNEEGESHVCNTCGKVSANRFALYAHIRRAHKLERRFECSVCPKSFKRNENLKEHMASHTGELLFQCPYCPKAYNSNGTMYAHRKNLHPIEFEEARKKHLTVVIQRTDKK